MYSEEYHDASFICKSVEFSRGQLLCFWIMILLISLGKECRSTNWPNLCFVERFLRFGTIPLHFAVCMQWLLFSILPPTLAGKFVPSSFYSFLLWFVSPSCFKLVFSSCRMNHLLLLSLGLVLLHRASLSQTCPNQTVQKPKQITHDDYSRGLKVITSTRKPNESDEEVLDRYLSRVCKQDKFVDILKYRILSETKCPSCTKTVRILADILSPKGIDRFGKRFDASVRPVPKSSWLVTYTYEWMERKLVSSSPFSKRIHVTRVRKQLDKRLTLVWPEFRVEKLHIIEWNADLLLLSIRLRVPPVIAGDRTSASFKGPPLRTSSVDAFSSALDNILVTLRFSNPRNWSTVMPISVPHVRQQMPHEMPPPKPAKSLRPKPAKSPPPNTPQNPRPSTPKNPRPNTPKNPRQKLKKPNCSKVDRPKGEGKLWSGTFQSRFEDCEACYCGSGQETCKNIVHECSHLEDDASLRRSAKCLEHDYNELRVFDNTSMFCSGFWREFVGRRRANCDMDIGSADRIISAGSSFKLEKEITGITGLEITEREYFVTHVNSSRFSVKPVNGHITSTSTIKIRDWKATHAEAVRRATNKIKRERRLSNKEFERRLYKKEVKRIRSIKVIRVKFFFCSRTCLTLLS